MRRVLLVLTAVLATPPSRCRAADPTGFALWKATELKQHDEALSKHVADDHSSRETLADYGDHRFRMLYRDATATRSSTTRSSTSCSCRAARERCDGRHDGRQARHERRASGSAPDSTAANVTPSAPATSSTSRLAFPTASSCRGQVTSPTCC